MSDAADGTVMPPLALLAGGLATRLRPITETVPKAMVEVAGEPFIAHQLRLFRREGVRDVVMCVGHLSQTLEDFVGDGRAFGLNVRWSHDGETRLGTGGALRRALPLLGDEFLVMYGDSYLDIPFAPVAAAFRAAGGPALMTVMENQGRWDASNVAFADGRVSFYGKGAAGPDVRFIDYGLLMLTSAVLADRPEGRPFDLGAVQSELAAAGRMAGFEIRRRFYEIGSHAGLAETEAYLADLAASPKPSRDPA